MRQIICTGLICIELSDVIYRAILYTADVYICMNMCEFVNSLVTN